MKRYFVALIVIFGLVEANVYAVTTRIFISNRTVPIAEGRKLVNGRMDFNWTNKQGYQTAKLERNGVIEVGVVYDDGTTDIKNLVMNLDDEIYFMELDWALGVIRAQKKANK